MLTGVQQNWSDFYWGSWPVSTWTTQCSREVSCYHWCCMLSQSMYLSSSKRSRHRPLSSSLNCRQLPITWRFVIFHMDICQSLQALLLAAGFGWSRSSLWPLTMWKIRCSLPNDRVINYGRIYHQSRHPVVLPLIGCLSGEYLTCVLADSCMEEETHHCVV